jgi:hypothetical protein
VQEVAAAQIDTGKDRLRPESRVGVRRIRFGGLDCFGSGTSLPAILTVAILATGFCFFETYNFFHNPAFITVDPHITPFWGPYGLNAYFARHVGMYDSSGQRLALRVEILLLVGLLLAAPHLRRFLPTFARPAWKRTATGVVVCSALAVYAYCLRRGGIYPNGRILGALVGLSGGLIVTHLAIYTQQRLRNRICLIVLVGLVLAADVPGFFTRFDLSTLNRYEVTFIEHHFSVVLGQAERLAAGHRLGELVTPTYGLLLHAFLAAFQHNVRPLTVGQIILILQCLQLLYLVLCIVVFARLSRGNYFLCLIVSLLVIPWYHFFHNGLLHPNQSSWRTIAFPIALLAIQLIYRRSLASSSFMLGVVAGILLLLNFESGIAAAAGLLGSLIYRTRFFAAEKRFRDLVQIAPFVPGILISCLFFAASWRLVLGYWPDPSVPKEMFTRLLFWSSSGVAGLPYPGDVMPVALLAGSIFILLHVALSGGARPHSTNAIRVTAATISIVWLPYYANRPAFWNLSSFAFLYAVVAIDAGRCLMLGLKMRRFTSFGTLSSLMITGLVTIPFIVDAIRYNLKHSPTSRTRWSAPGLALSPGTAELSGIILHEDLAKQIVAKTRALVQIGQSERLIFLTLHSYLIPKLSGLAPDLPVGDLVGEALKRSDYDRFLNYVKTSTAPEIYVDPLEESDRGANYYLDFYTMLLHDLKSAYRFDRSVDGWEIWVRNDATGSGQFRRKEPR